MVHEECHKIITNEKGSAMQGLQISLLGPFLVTREGRPVTAFATDAARALLAYLALEAGAPCRRERLAGLLWPDQPESEARHNLSQVLLRLRHALGDADAAPPWLLVTHEAIGLNAEAPWRADVAAFDRALTTCRTHLHRHLQTCPACIERLREAVALYRGELLSGFSLPSAPFEEWLRGEREQRRLQVLEALYVLAAYHERRGEHEQALHDARQLLALERWHEGAHRQAMRALAESGQRAAALAQYEVCRRALVEELGVEPETETTQLYEGIREHSGTGFLAGTRSLHNLPAQTTPFVGRERELGLLGGWLQEPGCRLVTLVGPGGSGKTRLALEVAAEQVYAFGHGAAFVPLAAVGTAEGMVPAIAQASELTLVPGEDPRWQLLAYLRDKELLLVLDNVEHLLLGREGDGGDGAALLADLLHAAPGLTVLGTSRARLELQAERIFSVPGMDYPTQDHLSQDLSGGGQRASAGTPVRSLAGYGAVQLYLHTARRVHPGYEPAADDLEPIVRLCRLVEGMPLAVVLAAAWSDALSPAQIADRVAQGLGALEAEWRDLPERQRSMRATFDASWRLLKERERAAFAALSVFRGGFTAEAAREVAGASLGTLRSLAHKSFLELEEGGRYRTHELLRQYGAEQLARAPEEEWAARDRHCAYYAAALRRWADEFKGPRQVQATKGMAAEGGNASVAWEWAVERERWADLGTAAEGLSKLYKRAGRYQEGRKAFEVAAAALEGARGDRSLLSVSEGVRLLLRVTACQIPFAEDAETWQRLIERCESLLSHPDLAGQDTRPDRALFLTYAVDFQPGLSERSLAYARQALVLCQEIGDRWGMAEAYGVLGIDAFLASDYEEARRRFAQQLEISRSLGYPFGLAGAMWWLSGLAIVQGQVEESERWLREWSALVAGWGRNPDDDPVGLWLVGTTHLTAGRYTEADAALEQGVAILREQGARIYLGRLLGALSQVKMHLGLYGQARKTGEEAVALARERGESWHEGRALGVLGSTALAEGQAAAAMELFEQADTAGRAGGDRLGLAEAMAGAGYAARRLGQTTQARQSLAQALQLGIQIRSLRPLWAALPAVALLLADGGEVERAVELYALAWSVPHIARSRWYEDVAGQELAAVTAGLQPEGREAALARGRAREIWATAEELLAELGQGES